MTEPTVQGVVRLHATPVGYLCLASGDAMRLMRFVFEESAATRHAFAYDDRLAKALDNRALGKAWLFDPDGIVATSDDPLLQRLARLTEPLGKDFDPEESRDKDGKWTTGGSTDASSSLAGSSKSPIAKPAFQVAPAAAAAAGTAEAAPVVAEAGAVAVEAAPEIVAATPGAFAAAAAVLAAVPPAALVVGAAAVLVVGGLLVARYLSRHRTVSGDISFRPGLSWTCTDGDLTVSQIGEDGKPEILYQGRAGPDHLFRDQDGNILGQNHGDTGVILDPVPIAVLSAKADIKNRSAPQALTSQSAATAAASAPASNDEEPRVCPAYVHEARGSKSERSVEYQGQITGRPGTQVKLNGVSFDGCRDSNQHMLEAKGEGYLWGMSGPDAWKAWYQGKDRIMRQVQRQAVAAALDHREVDWYFAEAPVAAYFRMRFAAEGYFNVHVYYEPYRPGEGNLHKRFHWRMMRRDTARVRNARQFSFAALES